jgi:hypothetical protein
MRTALGLNRRPCLFGMRPSRAPASHSSASCRKRLRRRCPQPLVFDLLERVDAPPLRRRQGRERLADLLPVPLRVDPRLIRRLAVATRAGTTGACTAVSRSDALRRCPWSEPSWSLGASYWRAYSRTVHLSRVDGRNGAKKKPRRAGLSVIGAPGFEPGTSCPPDKRANQAAPRPVRTTVPEIDPGAGDDGATS